MVLAYRDQIKFLDRLKLVVNAMKGLPPDTNFAQALADFGFCAPNSDGPRLA